MVQGITEAVALLAIGRRPLTGLGRAFARTRGIGGGTLAAAFNRHHGSPSLRHPPGGAPAAGLPLHFLLHALQARSARPAILRGASAVRPAAPGHGRTRYGLPRPRLRRRAALPAPSTGAGARRPPVRQGGRYAPRAGPAHSPMARRPAVDRASARGAASARGPATRFPLRP